MSLRAQHIKPAAVQCGGNIIRFVRVLNMPLVLAPEQPVARGREHRDVHYRLFAVEFVEPEVGYIVQIFGKQIVAEHVFQLVFAADIEHERAALFEAGAHVRERRTKFCGRNVVYAVVYGDGEIDPL